MKNIAQLCVTILLSCGIAGVARASESIDHLYQALVPIANASPEVQDMAMRQGLADALIKISGYRQTPTFDGLESVLSRAPQMVSEFGIRQTPRAADDGMDVQEVAALYMRFPAEQMASLLRQYEIPQWPALRPQTLVVPVSFLGGRPWLIGQERWPALYAELEAWSWRRGVPLKLLSQQDIARLGVSARAASELDELALQVVAELQQVERLAVVQVNPAQEDARLSLHVFGGVGITHQAETEGGELSDLLALLDDYADDLSLANAFVAVANANNSIRLVVQGVNSFQHYRQLKRQLDAIDQVDSLQLVRMQQSSVEFQLVFQSGLGQLQQAIGRLPALAAVPASAAGTDLASDRLVYRLREPLLP